MKNLKFFAVPALIFVSAFLLAPMFDSYIGYEAGVGFSAYTVHVFTQLLCGAVLLWGIALRKHRSTWDIVGLVAVTAVLFGAVDSLLGVNATGWLSAAHNIVLKMAGTLFLFSFLMSWRSLQSSASSSDSNKATS